MIGRLAGQLAEKNPPQILMDCHGVGYLVDVPMSTFYQLPAVGEAATLLTRLIVREDAQILYGFATAAERGAFDQLIRISGVGPRTALTVLSGMSVADLAAAVATQEATRFLKVPGIGKKTAARLLLELKGKLGSDAAAPSGSGLDAARSDILQALLSLGYSEREALKSLKALPAGVEVSDGIRQALKTLAR
ncbi:MAG: Holliday junction branch migration protein RuvA [Ottowia sp.]|nr:Holliday junction branch migration protein RuvA [Ottowia sp.]